MGEAMNRIKRLIPLWKFPMREPIIDTRNRIIHAYDNVRPEFLWSLVVRHIPELKKDVESILSEYEEQYNEENNMDSYFS